MTAEISKETTDLTYALLGNLAGINNRLARALSAKLDDEWMEALASAETPAAARTMFENCVKEGMERIAKEVRGG